MSFTNSNIDFAKLSGELINQKRDPIIKYQVIGYPDVTKFSTSYISHCVVMHIQRGSKTIHVGMHFDNDITSCEEAKDILDKKNKNQRMSFTIENVIQI